MAEAAQKLTRAVRVELVKPLGDLTWQEVGGHLHALRFAAHWVVNEAILAAIESDRRGRRGEKVGGSADVKAGRAAVLKAPTAAYQAAEELALPDVRAWASKRLNGKTEGDSLLARIARLEVPGGIRSSWSQQAMALFGKWNKNRGSERIPSTKKGAPILVRKQETKLSLDGKGPVLTLGLYAAGQGKPVRFAIKCGRGDRYGMVKQMSKGERQHGDCKIVYDERQKKWFGFISYTEPKPAMPATCDPKKVLIVHRGVRNALVVLDCSTGRFYREPGAKLLHQKRMVQARRLAATKLSKHVRGSGSRGHGKERRYQLPDHLQQLEDNIVKTWCQQQAAWLTDLGRRLGSGTIMIEEYGGIEQDGSEPQRHLDKFPLYQLKTAIEWGCAKAGFEFVESPAEYISTTCPVCSRIDPRSHNIRTNVFHCSCGLDRGADDVAVTNMAKHHGLADVVISNWRKETDLVQPRSV